MITQFKPDSCTRLFPVVDWISWWRTHATKHRKQWWTHLLNSRIIDTARKDKEVKDSWTETWFSRTLAIPFPRKSSNCDEKPSGHVCGQSRTWAMRHQEPKMTKRNRLSNSRWAVSATRSELFYFVTSDQGFPSSRYLPRYNSSISILFTAYYKAFTRAPLHLWKGTKSGSIYLPSFSGLVS